MKNKRFLRFSALSIAALLCVLGGGTVSADRFDNGVWHMVHAGGNDACEAFELQPGCDKNYSATAIQMYDGSVSGQFIDGLYGVQGVHGVVECMYVQDNAAFLLGTVKSKFEYGQTFIAVLEDNGTSRRDPPDRISWTFIVDAEDYTCDDGASLLPAILSSRFMVDYVVGQVTIR